MNLEPLNYDDNIEEENIGQLDNNLGFADFPSLRDLETSNAFTKSNLNIAENKA